MATTLDTYIAELLFDYDCVIIPQLGGFVTNYRPASIDEKSGVAHPAGKDVRFNRNLVKNDGLLAQAFAEAEGWSHEAANAHITAEVENYLSKLRGGEKLKFKKIGLLYLDAHRNFRFEPSNEQNFLKSAAGFEAFTLPPLLAVKTEEKALEPASLSAPVAQAESISETPVIPINAEPIHIGSNRSIYWVAAATLLPFIGLSIYVGLATGFKSPADITLAELNPFANSPKVDALYTPRNTENSDAQWASWPKPESEAAENIAPADPVEETVNIAVADTTSVNLASESRLTNNSAKVISGKYHIIGGCFREEENATKFVEQASKKGMPAAILDQHKGLYRVRLQSYDQYEDALISLEATREKVGFANAWMLKKPTY
jgi:hypothetical protein